MGELGRETNDRILERGSLDINKIIILGSFDVRVLSLLFVDFSWNFTRAVSSGIAHIVEDEIQILEVLGGVVSIISSFWGFFGKITFNEDKI